MNFCPSSAEKEARNVLGIGDGEAEIDLTSLLRRLDAKGLVYEMVKADDKPINCEGAIDFEGSVAYKVYAGFDESNQYVRSYLIVADGKGMVRYVDRRHMYRAPEF